ncbi:hypothetical protein CWI75_14225 [Kineobactrum sediminis]|uniref:Pilus assembly protein PilW n=1 Tax=Kineobactrum sediminis TaxID=1905677 RepID=A0A2N5XZQ8_9GAMM|nr:PilW family protein [Kineobactrum sediminis]PLW81624.1 hypothetical protein CWI75_14225 [Kineobactrum sediminis]
MISMLLGLLLSSAIVAIYLENRQQYLVTDEMARLHENGRFALNLLRRELMLAGFFGSQVAREGELPPAPAAGCSLTAGGAAVKTPGLDLLDDASGTQPVSVGGAVLDCIAAGNLQPGSDLLLIGRVAGEATIKNGVYQANTSSVATGHWYLRTLAPETVAGWWQAGTVPAEQLGNGTGVDYWRLHSRIFYVRRYSISAADGIPTLCAERLSTSGMNTQCLVEGIEHLQLEIGIDHNGDGVAELYSGRPNADQLEAAVVARLHLLVRSLSPVAGYRNSKRYQLGQTVLTAFNDRYLRRVFSTTIALRNIAAVAG